MTVDTICSLKSSRGGSQSALELLNHHHHHHTHSCSFCISWSTRSIYQRNVSFLMQILCKSSRRLTFALVVKNEVICKYFLKNQRNHNKRSGWKMFESLSGMNSDQTCSKQHKWHPSSHSTALLETKLWRILITAEEQFLHTSPGYCAYNTLWRLCADVQSFQNCTINKVAFISWPERKIYAFYNISNVAKTALFSSWRHIEW